MVRPFETNAGQYVPRASAPESAAFPALFPQQGGEVAIDGITGPGLGYRVAEIDRAVFRV